MEHARNRAVQPNAASNLSCVIVVQMQISEIKGMEMGKEKGTQASIHSRFVVSWLPCSTGMI